MRYIRIDNNAWELLNKAKDAMRLFGIEKPSYSDAIRWLVQNLKTSL